MMVDYSSSSNNDLPNIAQTVLLTSIGGILTGYHLAVMSPALPSLTHTFDLTPTKEENLVAILYLGSAIGGLLGGPLCDHLGRKKSILFTDVTFIVGALLISIPSVRYLEVLLGRFFIGVSLTISTISNVAYLSEMSPPQYRGSVVSINELCICLGMLFAYMMGYMITNAEEDTAPIGTPMETKDRIEFRLMFGVTIVWALIQLLAMSFFMPESPEWQRNKKYDFLSHQIIIQDEEEESKRSRFAWLKFWRLWWIDSTRNNYLVSTTRSGHGQIKNNNENNYIERDASMREFSKAISNLQEVLDEEGLDCNESINSDYDIPSVEASKSLPQKLPHDYSPQYYRSAFCVIAFIAIFQQLCGHTNVLNFAPELFSEVLHLDIGLEENVSSFVPAIFLGLIKLVVTLWVVWEVDKIGRRKLLIIGVSCITVSHVFLMGAFRNQFNLQFLSNDLLKNAQGEHYGDDYNNNIPTYERVFIVMGACGVVVGYSLSFGPITYLVTSELFPVKIKGRALAISAILTSFSAYISTFTIFSTEGNITVSPFIFYFIMSFISLVFIMFSIPEITTDEKTTEERMLAMRMWRRRDMMDRSGAHFQTLPLSDLPSYEDYPANSQSNNFVITSSLPESINKDQNEDITNNDIMNRESYSTEQLLKNNDPDEDIIVDTMELVNLGTSNSEISSEFLHHQQPIINSMEGILEQQSPHEKRYLEKLDSIDLNTHHSSSILNNSSEDSNDISLSIVDTTVSSNSANFNTKTSKSIAISSEDTESIARKYYNPNKEEKDTPSLGQTSQTTHQRDYDKNDLLGMSSDDYPKAQHTTREENLIVSKNYDSDDDDDDTQDGGLYVGW